MATCQTGISAEGFESIRLANSRLSVAVLPEVGGKICQLRNLATGRDWLWRNPHIPLRHPAPGLDYDRDLDSGGWDEILFSVKSCHIHMPKGQRLSIGDHGNAVDRAWRVIEKGVGGTGEAICTLEATGRSPDFKLHRKIALHAMQPSVKITYHLFNTGQQPWPWLWCAHPLLAVEHGMRIGLCAGQEMLLPGDERGVEASTRGWPELCAANGELIDLEGVYANEDRPEGFCQKVFVRSTGQASIYAPDGSERLEFSFDDAELPWIGLWINNLGWCGNGSEPYLNLGIEPATSPHDHLTDAVEAGEARWLEPGQASSWALSISLQEGDCP